MKRLNGTLTFIVTCIGVCTLAAASVSAEETAYEMSAYTNSPGGSEIAKGDYGAAIAVLEHRRRFLDSEDSLIAATNLCVAYTVTRVLDKAAAVCERAVTLAKIVETVSRRDIRRMREATTKAMTNRGVLRAVSGDSVGATADFKAAAKLSASGAAPMRNLAYLESLPVDRVARAEPSTR